MSTIDNEVIVPENNNQASQTEETPVEKRDNDGNSPRVRGKIELPALLPCKFPECANGVREEYACVPSLDFMNSMLGRGVKSMELLDFILCDEHKGKVKQEGVECFEYLHTLKHIKGHERDAENMQKFLRGYKPTQSRFGTRIGDKLQEQERRSGKDHRHNRYSDQGGDE